MPSMYTVQAQCNTEPGTDDTVGNVSLVLALPGLVVCRSTVGALGLAIITCKVKN